MIPRARMLLVERVVRNVNTSFELMNLWQMQCRPTPNNVRNILLILIILGNLKSEGCQTSLFFSCWYQYLNIIHRLNTSLLNRRFFFFFALFRASEGKREAFEENQTRAMGQARRKNNALVSRSSLALRLPSLPWKTQKNISYYAG